MKKKMLFPILILMMSLIPGCEVVTETEPSEERMRYLVVEGQLTNERTVHTVTLTESSAINYNGIPVAVSGASVSLSDGARTYELIEIRQGVYQTADTLQGEPGKAYTLMIAVGGKVYTATDTMPGIPPIKPLFYEADSNPGFYTWSVPNEHSITPGITYETTVRFIHTLNDGSRDTTDVTYYNFTGLDASALFALNEMSSVIRLKAGTHISQKKYALSRAYYKFLKAVYLETEWRGGLYDVTSANPPTNLSSGALGFFRTSAVSTLEQTVQ